MIKNNREQSLSSLLTDLCVRKKNRIAIGLLHDYPLSIKSLNDAKEFIDIIVVGPKAIEGFECIESQDAHTLIHLIKSGNVDAVFRGNFDAVELYNAIRNVYSFHDSLMSITPVLIKKINSITDNINALVSLLPISPSNYKGVASKILNIDSNIRFFKAFGITPRIGLLSAGKPSDVLEGIPAIEKTITEAEFLVNWYTKKGYNAKHFNHQIEYAVQESEIIVYPDGISGNQAARAMHFFGDTEFFGNIVTNLPFVYGQTAEAFRDWSKCLFFLNAYMNCFSSTHTK